MIAEHTADPVASVWSDEFLQILDMGPPASRDVAGGKAKVDIGRRAIVVCVVWRDLVVQI
ncbi:hypothetical protein A3840_14215 [Devosia elaeis]|uniref:Uncharacterized protein n=1 Tax=Devosia elaeis TaxID=1770058 RepID=A0A178HT40_9HYPH|nr:hypothetical protein A3840_14215 [Devosia elaeis]